MKSHYLEKKSQKRKRGFRKTYEIDGNDVPEVKRLLAGFRRNK